MRFDNRIVLITGAAGDIGRATATHFAALGAQVIITDRDALNLGTLAQSLDDAGANFVTHVCDQTDPASVAELFAAVAAIGSLDAAFVNAGFGRYGALIDLTFEQWRRHIDVNLNGGFLMAQAAARSMIESGRGGAMVFNASTAANHVCDMLGAYAASKSGLLMLARSLASELGVHRIRVNSVMPGVIETSMTRSLLGDPATRADVLSETPVGRLGQPADIAALVAFLCSDEAGYITGAEILIDGGQTIHGYPRWFSANYTQPNATWNAHATSHPVQLA